MTVANLLSNWYRRRARARVRALLRVHRAILRAKLDLENHRLVGMLEEAGSPAPDGAVSGLVPPPVRDAAETCLRQRCLTMNFSFLLAEAGKHLAAPGTPLVMPVPKRWRAHLRRQGLTIAARSRLRFAIVVVDSLIAGLRAARLLILAQRRGWLVEPPAADYHVFVGANAGNLPDATGRGERRNLHSWYRSYYRLEEDYPFVAENRDVDRPQRYGKRGAMAARHFPPLGPEAHRDFVGAAVGLMAQAIAATLTGRWWQAILLADLVELAYVRRIADRRLARRYVLHAGNCLVRPLWTYDAEARGSEVVNVFYSANFITFTPNPDVRPARTLALSTMSWPEMICLDDESRRALIDYGVAAETLTVSDIPIDFLDDGSPLPVLRAPVVMLFDVTPYRPYFKATRGFHNAYYTAETWRRFIDDILGSARRHGWTVALKAKRQRGRFNAPAYQRHIDRLAADPGVVILEAGIGASRALTVADAVISMPFTSPSQIAARLGRPGVVYDPGGTLMHERPLARGLPMLTSPSELDAWFQSLGTKAAAARPAAQRQA